MTMPTTPNPGRDPQDARDLREALRNAVLAGDLTPTEAAALWPTSDPYHATVQAAADLWANTPPTTPSVPSTSPAAAPLTPAERQALADLEDGW